jgi:hypothetical protein
MAHYSIRGLGSNGSSGGAGNNNSNGEDAYSEFHCE